MTPKRERFIQEYGIDRNGTQAAIRAGYSANSAKVIASELLTKPDIMAAIRAQDEADAVKAGVSREWVIERLKANADRAMQVEPVYDRDGNETGVYRYEGSVANRALELLGKQQGMFSEKVDHTLVANINIQQEWTFGQRKVNF